MRHGQSGALASRGATLETKTLVRAAAVAWLSVRARASDAARLRGAGSRARMRRPMHPTDLCCQRSPIHGGASVGWSRDIWTRDRWTRDMSHVCSLCVVDRGPFRRSRVSMCPPGPQLCRLDCFDLLPCICHARCRNSKTALGKQRRSAPGRPAQQRRAAPPGPSHGPSASAERRAAPCGESRAEPHRAAEPATQTRLATTLDGRRGVGVWGDTPRCPAAARDYRKEQPVQKRERGTVRL